MGNNYSAISISLLSIVEWCFSMSLSINSKTWKLWNINKRAVKLDDEGEIEYRYLEHPNFNVRRICRFENEEIWQKIEIFAIWKLKRGKFENLEIWKFGSLKNWNLETWKIYGLKSERFGCYDFVHR